MNLSRRKILALGAGAVGVGVAYRAIKGHGIAAHALDVIRTVYGQDMAQQSAASEFAQAYEEFVLEKGAQGRMLDMVYWSGLDDAPYVEDYLSRIDKSVIDKFATSTNVIKAAEEGVPLEFFTVFDPLQTPCMNQLGALAVS